MKTKGIEVAKIMFLKSAQTEPYQDLVARHPESFSSNFGFQRQNINMVDLYYKINCNSECTRQVSRNKIDLKNHKQACPNRYPFQQPTFLVTLFGNKSEQE